VWSIANEQESETPENEDYLGPLFDGARQADRSRPPTSSVSCSHAKETGQISQFGYLLIPLQPITAEPCIGQVLSAVVRGSDGPAGQVIIAYEPFWTIGALQPAPSAYVADVCQRVRIALADQLSDFALVYGGSAGPGLLTALGANVDGLFLGRFAHDPGAVAEVLSEATLPRWTGTHRRT
jgi:Triosephosphate isomerase